MGREVSQSGPRKGDAKGRDARLKAALKANMARRKAQARARAETDDQDQMPVPGDDLASETARDAAKIKNRADKG